MIPEYHYHVQSSDEDRDIEYIGLCTEFPSLSWIALTQSEALSGITRLVADTCAEMLWSGEEIPPVNTQK